METVTPQWLEGGYICLPKAVLYQMMKLSKKAEGPFEAFLLVLQEVNYSPTTCVVHGRSYLCGRGESMLTFGHWANRLGWSRGQTRCFFYKMAKMGWIELRTDAPVAHIRIPHYDLLVGAKRVPKPKQELPEDGFTLFWDEFHDITQTDRVNIARARREWKKLSPTDRTLAIRQIGEYYTHLRSVRYCMQAASYLSNKAFLNQYND